MYCIGGDSGQIVAKDGEVSCQQQPGCCKEQAHHSRACAGAGSGGSSLLAAALCLRTMVSDFAVPWRYALLP
eukprot:133672-Chlamydomonas_euryale.AAC.1